MKRSPLRPKPGKPWKKLEHKVPIRQAAPKQAGHRKRGSRIPEDVIRVVTERSGGVCEARTPWCQGRATTFHHKRGKDHNGPEDILHVCHGWNACHPGYIHGHPEESYRRGWMLKRNSISADPLTAETEPG